jgi:hypothetical protein
MNSQQTRTLERIFENPVRSDVLWSDVENLFHALDAFVSERAGSRIIVSLNDAIAVFHRPHPERTTDKGALKAVRKFLIKAGVKPL